MKALANADMSPVKRSNGPVTVPKVFTGEDAHNYLDYNATTPVAPAVREAMLPYLVEHFGNPSSSHILGLRLPRCGGRCGAGKWRVFWR